MSLINQMLKELDARRSDVGGADAYRQQVRAVPERRRIHPAWYAAVVATLLLVIVLAWLLLRPAPQAVRPPAQQLPLKLDIDLAKSPAPEADTPTASAVDVPKPAASNDMVDAQALAAGEASAPAKAAARGAQTAPREQERKPSTEIQIPTVANIVPAAKTLAVKPAKESTPSAPPALSKQVKELTPQQRADNEYRKAAQAMQDNRLADAIKGFETALHLDTHHTGARYALIAALLDSRRQEEALIRAREGLSLDSAQPGLSMILARLQLEKGELRSAIETLERTLPYAADRADYQAFLAALMQRDERHKQAIEHYLIALRIAPQNGVWWMGIGISLQAERRLPEALEAFKRAKASNSLSPELIAFVDARLAQLQR